MKSKLRITTLIFFCLALAFQVDAAAGTSPADHLVRGTPTEARTARSVRPVIENIGGGTIEEPKLLPGIDTGETSGASPSSDKADLDIPIQISDDALLASRIENGDPYAMYEFGVRILKSNPTEDQYAAAVGALLNAANDNDRAMIYQRFGEKLLAGLSEEQRNTLKQKPELYQRITEYKPSK